VNELQGSYQVAVVGADNKVEMRPVKPGERVDSLWVIDEGLKPGERVVAEGLQKVKPGILVQPKPFVATATAINPQGGGRSAGSAQGGNVQMQDRGTGTSGASPLATPPNNAQGATPAGSGR
jgi:hypothetical protein